tara:strand:+ start:1105 stop:1842 length:738 start_codon:yes stop_codon:yes gene_type:complete
MKRDFDLERDVAIGVFDIDSLLYEVCCKEYDSFDDVKESYWNKYNSIVFNLKRLIPDYTLKMVNIGLCRNNYRKVVDPTYKSNRKSDKPEYFQELVDYLKVEGNIKTYRYIETDDAVQEARQFYKQNGYECFIISIDKDYNQFEGLVYNYRDREFKEMSSSEACYNFYYQMIIGDSSDGYNYLKGFGKKYAEKHLKGKNEFAMRRVVYSCFKQLYKSKSKEKYIQQYLLCRLNHFGQYKNDLYEL